jgi:pyrroline-5-carboxylate reductase
MIAQSSLLSGSQIGFLGCGKISSAMIRGYCSISSSSGPKLLHVSKRSEDKSRVLSEEFPKRVNICESNEYLVQQSDFIFIGLLPATAREILPSLDFSNKYVISMMAAVNYEEVGPLMHKTHALLIDLLWIYLL